jgi:outer membrane receptor protein involved in Fe transport
LFDTWAGPVAFNVGYEQREEKGSFVPDAYLQAGTGRSVPITPTAGSFDTKEFFGETIIPLVAPSNEIPLVRRVNLVGKARYVDNTVNGGFTSSTFSLQYQPIADIEVRGNVTRSLRAPSIVELFLPQAGLFSFINHPCDSRAITAPGTTRATNCESFFRQYGITPPFTFTAWSASTQGTTAGNASLLNEVAESWTAGIVFRPAAVPGLQMAADWIDIDITKVITSLSATQLAVACFDSTAYPSNPFCPRIQYTANGQAAGFQAGFVNGNALTVSGLVANVEYGFNLADLGFSANAGRLRARLDWYYEDAAYQVTAVGARTDFPGTVGEPRNQVVLGVNYLRGPFTFFWQTQYQSSVVFSRTDTAESRDILQLGDYYLHNASVAFQLPSKKTTLRLALSNVLDDAAPFPITGTGAYDILGRRLSLSFTHDF